MACWPLSFAKEVEVISLGQDLNGLQVCCMFIPIPNQNALDPMTAGGWPLCYIAHMLNKGDQNGLSISRNGQKP